MKCGACFVVLTGLTLVRPAEQSTGSVIRAIQIAEDGGITRVTIEADGPLPIPRSASLTDPPRIYFDLEGVTHTRGTTVAERGGVVSRVRVALRTASPKVTRVVLDLTRLESYRVDSGERQAGRIRVIVGTESAIGPGPATRGAVASPAAPVPANSSSPAVAPAPIAAMPTPPVRAANSTPAKVEGPATIAPTPSPVIARPAPIRNPVLSPQEPPPPLPMQQVAAYRKQISGELARMESLRALVARIDAGESLGSDALKFAAEEFTNLRRILEAAKPAAVLALTHDVLMTSCTFGAMASRLGLDAALDGNPETRRRAQSAAAGSLMLFDRACSDLGCARAPR